MITRVEYLKGLPPGVWKRIGYGTSKEDGMPTGYQQLPEQKSRGYIVNEIKLESGLVIPEHSRVGVSTKYIVIAGSAKLFTRLLREHEREEGFVGVGDSFDVNSNTKLRLVNDGRRGDLYMIRISLANEGVEPADYLYVEPTWTEEIIPSE